MEFNFNKVAILYGGKSLEREISLMSGQAVYQALINKNINAELFDPSEQDIFELKKQGFDVAFVVLHGGSGENGEIQSCLEMMAIPYTGSDSRACVLSDDKYLTKLLWEKENLPIADYVLVNNESKLEACEQLGFPLFMKPTREGSSIGVHKIKDRTELLEVYTKLSTQYTEVIAETFLSGGEFSCPIIGSEALPVVKIEPSNEFYDYEAKYLRNDTVYSCPAGLSEEDERYAKQICLQAFNSLGCSNWGRVDFMRGVDGKFYLLEVNAAPGMTTHSLVPKSAFEYGLNFEQLCLRILSYAT
ncbi:MAG: D-alanine--D-alanine ligase [Neisseriaceae bacterium]|nr:MAG: D-alanine--D-alanine ligase [Neisseriaceae bacterium]